MKLTEAQEQQIATARAAGSRRALLDWNDDQRLLWEHGMVAEKQARGDTTARIKRLREAASLPGFFGDIRRAISAARIREEVLATAIGVHLDRFQAFREGVGDLPADALERLVEALGLRLMHEIPGSAR